MVRTIVSYFGTRDPALPASVEAQVSPPGASTCAACGGLIMRRDSGVVISSAGGRVLEYQHASCYLDALRGTSGSQAPLDPPSFLADTKGELYTPPVARYRHGRAGRAEPVVLHVDFASLSRLEPECAILLARETRKRCREAADVASRVASPIEAALGSLSRADVCHAIVGFAVIDGIAHLETAVFCAGLKILGTASWPIGRPAAFTIDQVTVLAEEHAVNADCLTRTGDKVTVDLRALAEAFAQLNIALSQPVQSAGDA